MIWTRYCPRILCNHHQYRLEPDCTLEVVTSCRDVNIRVWRIKILERRTMMTMSSIPSVKAGTNLGRFYASGLTFRDAVGLGLTIQTLLVQRGGVDSNLVGEDDSEDIELSPWHQCTYLILVGAVELKIAK
ncbi:hypothetical protein K457DRAFT_26096 [Linnemannia elongata AG-77]|uniref:WD40 repeat-like protein n=1 Tax=Linnemannia elongata AG-77 TaxID=1314771 RepID=A0A197JBB7_9FUNG|nr:hypothetical protein K457DRAFT_26096 [Linnemannia elongata AG-77]